MSEIKNIIFDLGGVLADLDYKEVINAYDRLGFTEADELLNPYRQKGIFLDLERGTATPEDLYEYIRKKTGKNIPGQLIDDALNSFIVGIPLFKLDMLIALRKKFKVFMLSNTNIIMLPVIDKNFFTQQGLQMKDYFDRVFASYEMGMVKPDAEIYLKVLSEAAIKAEETLFIDDGKANVDSALSLGFNVYLAKPQEDYRHIFDGL